jgi:hypothetical protein
MTGENSTVLVMGLPEAGKTTFLAALWHVAESEEIESSMVLDSLSDDAKHLNFIKGAWLQNSKVGRTNENSEQVVSMPLRERHGTKRGTIIFPDLSGETYRRQWTDRYWTQEYADLAERAVGAILFIHPNQIVAPITLAQGHQVLEAADPGAAAEVATAVRALFEKEEQDEISDHDPSPGNLDESVAVGSGISANTWSPDKATPQVQIVELLQFLARRSLTNRPIRLAVVVSAWDLVEDISTGVVIGDSAAWIQSKAPLLHQYLTCNGDQFQSVFYALSAQGGDTKDSDSRNRWRNTAIKSERVVIAGPECVAHDITEPVRRVLGLRD